MLTMAASSGEGLIQLEEGWAELKSSYIEPVAAYVVDTTANDEQLAVDDCCSSELFVSTYTLMYTMCTQQPPYNFSDQLYERYIGTIRAFVGAYSKLLGADHLAASWKSCRFLAEVMRKPLCYLDRYYIKHRDLASLQAVALQVFRTAIEAAHGSAEAANAVVAACNDIRDDDKQKLIAAQSDTTPLSADVAQCTSLKLNVVVKTDLKLADLCLKQLRTALASEIKRARGRQRHASLCEQLRVVQGVFVGRLTFNDLLEHWQSWDPTYVNSIWAAFNKTETLLVAQDAVSDEDDFVDEGTVGSDAYSIASSSRPAKKAKLSEAT
jgi:hypothetical protein